MKKEILSEKEFKDLIELAYEDYFPHLLEEPIVARFIKGMNIEELKKREIQGVIKFYRMYINDELQELKEELISLGKLHYNLKIEFTIFLENLNNLELTLIKKIFSIKKNVEEIFFLISKFFEIIKNYTAKGYLIEYIKKEQNIIRTYIEQSLGEKLINVKSVIDKHISWEENILDFLITNRFKKKIEIDSSKCDIGRWLKSIKTSNTEALNNLHNLHDKLHLIAENIITFKKLGKYTLLIDEYNQFIKQNLLFMSTLITFLFNEEIEELQRDPLTNLLTRRSLENIYFDVMDISLITGEPFGVAFLDIDDFKKINDTYGHDVGDLILKEIADILRNTLRRSDYIFRYGGEEFVIITPAVGKESFYRILEKIRQKIYQTKIKINEHFINVSVSIGGVVVESKHIVPLSKVIKKADILMYQAKKSGKNKVIVKTLKIT